MTTELKQELREFVEKTREQRDIPGIAIGVLVDGELLLKEGYGVVSRETNWPVTPDTLFMIASNTKVFTTTLLMTLVDEGKVDLDAPITEYLPQLRLTDEAALRKMVVRHFITHQTGIWGNNPQDLAPAAAYGPDALKAVVDRMSTAPQMYQPGELWAYTNVNFTLAGALIEMVTGQLFEDVMRERILDPLGMERTFFGPYDIFGYPNAVGHAPRDLDSHEIEVLRRYESPRVLYPTGGLQSTVEDLLKFDLFHLGGKAKGRPLSQIISEESRIEMQANQIQATDNVYSQGLGWRLRQGGGVPTYGHAGGWIGCITRNTVFPNQNAAFAIYTNSGFGNAAIDEIERWLAEQVLELTLPVRERVALPTGALNRFAGEYENPEMRVIVGISGDELELAITDLYDVVYEYPRARYYPISELEFMELDAPDQDSQIDFILSKDGAVKFMRHGTRVVVRH
jgi:CubicO group peptidase (beta-lactamase class C family)